MAFIENTEGSKTLNGSSTDDTIYSSKSSDIYAGDGNDSVIGSHDKDTVYGDNGDDTLFGNSGDDLLYGGAGADSISGGKGSDVLYGGAGADTLTGGEGSDIFVLELATAYNNIDIITDFQENNVFEAIDISELLTAYNPSTDDINDFVSIIDNGTDTHLYVDGDGSGSSESSTQVLTLQGTTGITVDDLAAQNKLITGTHNRIVGSDTTETHTGTAASDIIYTDLGGDTVNAGAGADFIHGHSSSETIHGDDGNDTIFGNSGKDTLYGDAGADTIDGGAGKDAIWGGTGNDTIYGAGGLDTINGEDGDDTIYGGSFGDVINGGNDNDTIYGERGADTMDGGAGNDTFYLANKDFRSGESITGGAGTDEIILSNASTIDFSTGTLSGVETLTGSSGNDVVTMTGAQLTGGSFTSIDLGAGTNSLVTVGTVDLSALSLITISNAGNKGVSATGGDDSFTLTGAQLDTLLSGSGIIDMGLGYDTLNITSTSDDLNTLGLTDASIVGVEVISASTATSGVTIDMSGQTEGFKLVGSDSADTLTGSANSGAGVWDNVLSGGDGLDDLYGYDGGIDQFVFESASAFNNVDTINNFNTTDGDALNLSDLLTEYDPMTEAITDFVQITDNGTDSFVLVDVNGTGTFGKATMIASVIGVTGLTDEAALETAGNIIV